MSNRYSSILSNRKSLISSYIRRNSQPYEDGRLTLCTGSQYMGPWNLFGMHGECEYVYPDGLKYVGVMNNGHFHGAGKLIFPNGNTIHGHWVNGICTKMIFKFADGLEFKEKDWDYCQPKVHRAFAPDETHSLQGIGAHLQMPRTMDLKDKPNYCYHTGEGIYNPNTKCLYSKKDPNVILRIPTKKEEKWIMQNYPKAEIERVECRQDFLEETPYVEKE